MKKIRASVAAGISIGVLACSFACGAMIYAVAQKTLPLNPALESSYCVGDVIELEDIGIETDGKILKRRLLFILPKGMWMFRMTIPWNILGRTVSITLLPQTENGT